MIFVGDRGVRRRGAREDRIDLVQEPVDVTPRRLAMGSPGECVLARRAAGEREQDRGARRSMSKAPFLGQLAPLSGDLVDRNPASLRLGMGREHLTEAPRDGGVGDGSRAVSLAHRLLLASENPEPATYSRLPGVSSA